MQLFDNDLLVDDSDFDGSELYKEVKIKNNQGVLELELCASWANDLDNEWFNYRDIYWKAIFKQETLSIKSCLKIFFSERMLYVQPSSIENLLPEIYDKDGSQMVLVAINDILEYGLDSSLTYVKKGIGKIQENIVLAKIEKGYLG